MNKHFCRYIYVDLERIFWVDISRKILFYSNYVISYFFILSFTNWILNKHLHPEVTISNLKQEVTLLCLQKLETRQHCEILQIIHLLSSTRFPTGMADGRPTPAQSLSYSTVASCNSTLPCEFDYVDKFATSFEWERIMCKFCESSTISLNF